MNYYAYLILLVLALVFLILNVVKGFPIWPTVLVILLFLVLTLAGCTIDENGDPVVRTPTLTIPIPKTASTVFGYGMIGFHSDKVSQLIQQTTYSKDN